MDKQRLDLLKRLSEVSGISGDEREVAKLVKAELADVADSIEFDNLGSLIATVNGKDKDAPVVMLSAHMDEVGFVVRAIEKGGYLRLHNVGGWWPHVVLAQEFTVKTRDGKEYLAVSGAQPPHGMPAEQRNRVLEVKDLYLDLGVSSDEDVKNLGIRLGDTVTPRQSFAIMNDGKTLLGKAWDDRVAVAVGIEVLKEIKKLGIDATVVLAATVQEEVGLRGARTSAQKIKPDLAFALDVTMSYDLPGSPVLDTKLGAGAALSVMDGSVIAHRGLFDYVEAIAKKHDVKYTYDVMTAGGTDSGEIHKVGEGVVNMTLSIPCRYFHSHTSLVHYDDVSASIDLLVHTLKTIKNDTLTALRKTKYE